jgi:DNA-binding response OmpR family regulator
MSLVLIAEDDADLRELLALTLTDAGIDVEVAADGREALEHVKAHMPDLVLLDMMMPVMDGRGFCAAIRDFTKRPPIVVMTAAGRAVEDAAELGAMYGLAKPFEIDELVATIRRCLQSPP